MPGESLVAVHGLSKVFRTRGTTVRAVDDVSFQIPKGTTLGLVGESGSGKSTVARLVLGLETPTDGAVHFAGRDLADMSKNELHRLRRRMQMIFQNPYGSLLPHYSAAANVAEPLRLHGVGDRSERRTSALRLLDLVGIGRRTVDLYPYQFSGGQQQRIAIARALALQPDFLVCDEPTSALDVSIQAQILRLLAELQAELSLTCLFISHNLAVVEQLAHQIAVMCRGELVEMAPTEQIFTHPSHEYTRRLLSAVLPVRNTAGATPP